MCCFSGTVDVVADTNIFARASKDGRQFLVYSMTFAAEADLASPVRRDDLIGTLLARALDLLPPDAAEAMAERTFFSIYSSPALQAAMGVDPKSSKPQRHAGMKLVTVAPNNAARAGHRCHRDLRSAGSGRSPAPRRSCGRNRE